MSLGALVETTHDDLIDFPSDLASRRFDSVTILHFTVRGPRAGRGVDFDMNWFRMLTSIFVYVGLDSGVDSEFLWVASVRIPYCSEGLDRDSLLLGIRYPDPERAFRILK